MSPAIQNRVPDSEPLQLRRRTRLAALKGFADLLRVKNFAEAVFRKTGADFLAGCCANLKA